MADPVKYFIGNELFVYMSAAENGVGSAPLAYATECTLSISAAQIDTSNKQSGTWASALPGQLSWSVSASALYTSANNFHTIFETYRTRTKLYVAFGEITSLASENFDLDTAKTHYEGWAYITSMELNAGNGEVASFSIELTGEGELTQS